MDILIKGLDLKEGACDYNLTIRSDGKVEGSQQIVDRIHRINTWAIEVPEHGRLVSAEDFIDSFEDIINECRRQLSEKGEDITVLNYFHDTIVELMGYMPTVLEASNGSIN